MAARAGGRTESRWDSASTADRDSVITRQCHQLRAVGCCSGALPRFARQQRLHPGFTHPRRDRKGSGSRGKEGTINDSKHRRQLAALGALRPSQYRQSRSSHRERERERERELLLNCTTNSRTRFSTHKSSIASSTHTHVLSSSPAPSIALSEPTLCGARCRAMIESFRAVCAVCVRERESV